MKPRRLVPDVIYLVHWLDASALMEHPEPHSDEIGIDALTVGYLVHQSPVGIRMACEVFPQALEGPAYRDFTELPWPMIKKIRRLR